MSYRVLIVDDSKLARMSVAKALNSLQPGWIRSEASNAEEALACLAEGGADIVLLDFNMPGRDGLALATELHRLNPDMPLALISANTQDEIVTRAREVGATFLSKPLTVPALGDFLSAAQARLRAIVPVNLPPAIELDDLQRDALTELVNIGVSRAAASLREMVGEQVLLAVPAVAIITTENAAQIISRRDPDRLVAVHQAFAGELSGRALLIFPGTNSLELVRAVIDQEMPLEDILDLEQEALGEIGNIILNSCLASIANMLQRSLKVSLPEILRGNCFDLFGVSGADRVEDFVLFLYINFSINQRNIRGYIAMLMDLPSLASLKILIDEFIQRSVIEIRPHHVVS